jgi:amidohydrolase
MDIYETLKCNAYLAKKIIQMRRLFHQYPELSNQEHQTCKRITQYLKDIGVDKIISPYCETGVLAYIKGSLKSRKVVALRADIDALPIEEQNKVPYRSKNKGVMHACGHDTHMAMLLGAAELLVKTKNKWGGLVKLIFQPAEERVKGAESVIKAGALQNPEVDFIFALHVYPDIHVGSIGIVAGPVHASCDNFYITVKGAGGHGAHPEACIDPILAANHLCEAIRAISRNFSGLESHIISICSIHGGTATNIIPDEVKMSGTVRAFSDNVRDIIEKRLKQVIAGIDESFRVKSVLKYERMVPQTFNHPEACEYATKVADALGIKKTNYISMGSEDFSLYVRQVKGAILGLGVCSGKRGNKPLHSSAFEVEEKALPQGSSFLAGCAIAALTD